MAKKKTKEVVEKATEDNATKVDLSQGKTTVEDNVVKVNLDKPLIPKEENEVKKDNTVDEGVVAEPDNAESTEKQEEVQPKEQAQEETPVLEEITEEEVKEQTEELAEEVVEAVAEAQQTGEAIPENLQKVVDFMEDTGGTLEDYVRLNQDFSNYDDKALLREYYKNTKSHLDSDEIDFLIEEDFSYDEEIDEERDIKKKKIALKEGKL